MLTGLLRCYAARNDEWSKQSEVPRLINGEYMWCKMMGSLRKNIAIMGLHKCYYLKYLL